MARVHCPCAPRCNAAPPARSVLGLDISLSDDDDDADSVSADADPVGEDRAELAVSDHPSNPYDALTKPLPADTTADDGNGSAESKSEGRADSDDSDEFSEGEDGEAATAAPTVAPASYGCVRAVWAVHAVG